MFGSFTGVFHPICNAPMLGAHLALHLTRPEMSVPGIRSSPTRTGQVSYLVDMAADMSRGKKGARVSFSRLVTTK